MRSSEELQQIKMGVDWIKVHVSGYPIRPGKETGEISTWTLDELAGLRHRTPVCIPVVGHCRNVTSTRDAALAGFDMILHATYMDDEALKAVTDRKVPLVPFLSPI